MSRVLRIAAAQLGPVPRSAPRSEVVERLLLLLHGAHARDCRLVVFPEAALTGFFPHWYMESEDEIESYFEREMPGPETRPLFDAARRLGVGFYLGYAELATDATGRHRYNAAILVGADAEIVGKYRKIHLPGHADHRPRQPYQNLEKLYFEVGDLGFPVFRAFGTVIGMCICNDRRWAETWRVLALQGAELVLLGYNTPILRANGTPEPAHLPMLHNRISLQAGAYQNALWAVAAAKAGVEEGVHQIGGSSIVAPTGEIVAEAAGEGDELVIWDCDLEHGRYLRESTFDFARHRRIEHYRLIAERTGIVPPPGPAEGEQQ